MVHSRTRTVERDPPELIGVRCTFHGFHGKSVMTAETRELKESGWSNRSGKLLCAKFGTKLWLRWFSCFSQEELTTIYFVIHVKTLPYIGQVSKDPEGNAYDLFWVDLFYLFTCGLRKHAISNLNDITSDDKVIKE